MSRDDLLRINADIVQTVVREVAKRAPQAILLIVSNPLDAMTYVAFRESGFPKERVMGMAGALDAARLRAFIAMELGVSVDTVHALVLGGHGDTMVPLVRYTSISGIPITDILDGPTIEQIVERTRNGGAEIVKHLKTGSAYYAPSSSVVEMVESVLKDKKKVLPCTAYLEGEYGVHGLFIGVPVKLGARGIEQIYELKLTPDEQAALDKSRSAVEELVHVLEPHLK
jgi:malate dehydrogenase